jgi:hypothetical protein
MEIIAHRGLWELPEQKNSAGAIRAAIANGFGIEVDLRDRAGRLVIAHDPADESAADFEEVLASLSDLPALTLALWALNIKADGLQRLVLDAVKRFALSSAFCFDMSVPDGLGYLNLDSRCRVYTRQSEFEPEPPFYDEADGVWLDEFNAGWITDKIITGHWRRNKRVCIVSAELHGRAQLRQWDKIKKFPSSGDFALQLCTDHPVQAREFFDD